MTTNGRTRRVLIECPRCSHKSVRANNVGAWCDSFPCRWHVRWSTLKSAVRVMGEAGIR